MKARTSVIVLLAALSVGLSSCASAAPPSPKNIIIMICDGCGYNHVDAAGLYQFGRTGAQPYEGFPVRLAMSTYPAGGSYEPKKAWSDFEYVTEGKTDSAAAATAMATGVKTYNGAIGVDPNRRPVENLVERCEKLGKATGVVTSVQWSHATPAGFVAHNPKRGNHEEISAEMIASGVEVIMGAGHPFYDDEGKPADEPKYKYIGRQTWLALNEGTAASDTDADGVEDPWTLIQTKTEFLTLMTGDTPKRVCGTVQVGGTLQQERAGPENAAPYKVDFIDTVPTLRQMTRAAINVLDEDPDGFLLMIEGGAVDWASHDNQAGRMIEEMIAFNSAIEGVINWIEKHSSWDRTLLIITGDHETGYITGPESGPTESGPVWSPLANRGAGKVPAFKWHGDGHTNSLVPFYAKGCGARLYEKAAVETDPVSGRYLDNTDVAGTIFTLLGVQPGG
ncbi:MAG: alkaline phosphatase [Planctomycetota bacterium]